MCPSHSLDRCILATVLCLSLCFSHARGQNAPASASGPQSQGTQEPIATLPNDRPLHVPGNTALYRDFLEYVGREDDQIQAAQQQGKSVIPERIDYAKAIGLTQGETETILSILLNAYHKRQKNQSDVESTRNELQQEYGDQEGWRRWSKNVAQVGDANTTILLQAWVELRKSLSPESFQSLDAYVNKEFVRGPFPASLTPHQETPHQEGVATPTPLPLNVRYYFFFQYVSAQDANVQRQIRQGQKVIYRLGATGQHLVHV